MQDGFLLFISSVPVLLCAFDFKLFSNKIANNRKSNFFHLPLFGQ